MEANPKGFVQLDETLTWYILKWKNNLLKQVAFTLNIDAITKVL